MNGKIWVLGDAVVDLLPGGEGRLLQCPGGTPANIAVDVTQLGDDNGFVSRVGDDPFGRFIRHTLVREQIDVNYMRLNAAQYTSTVVVDLDQRGERTFTFMVRPNIDLFLQPEGLPPFAAGQWLYICPIALSAGPSRSTAFATMEAIERAGGCVSFDPNVRNDLWQDPWNLRDCLDRAPALTDVIKPSEKELAFVNGSDDVVGGIVRLNAHFQPTLLLVIQGKAGVQVALCGQVSHFPARPMATADTTGASDAFVAGLLVGLAVYGIPNNLVTLIPDLTLAQAYSVLAITARSAMTALPHRDDLQRSL